MDVVYGETVELPLLVTYNGNKVKISNSDVDLTLSNSTAGSFDGLNFTAATDSGLRNTRVTAFVSSDYGISANMTLSFFDKDEAYFDFDNAMYGSRTFAWNREVSNSDLETKVDEGIRHDTYYAVDPSKPMVTDYTFAIDMTSVPIPEQFGPLLQMVAGTDVLENIRCWDILLQLAERVSALTNVTVTLDVDPNLDVDVSNIKIVNDFFELTDSSYDADAHKLTFKLNFIKRGQAVRPDEANPIVIVSGVSLTPAKNASWDANDEITAVNYGSISYDIYLGASTLYSMSSQQSFQQQYGIYPYTEPSNHAHPSGGHFASTFTNFEDTYTLNNAMKQGWFQVGGNMSYFVDNVPQTGILYVEGIYPEQDKKFYFDLGDDGVSRGKVTGLFEFDGDYYYAVDGELMKGWRTTVDENGNELIYHLDYTTGKAADGVYTTSGHTYTFENHVLVKGSWETDENNVTHYWWAGRLIQYRWISEDGKEYYAKPSGGEIAKGLQKVLNHKRDGSDWYLFDSNTGEWLSSYNGLYTQVENGVEKTYLIKNGIRVAYPGLFELDGDLYYINSSYVLIKNQDYYVSKTNGLIAAGTYTFDADGKLTILDGIVKDGDVWTYYVNGKKTYAGLIEIDGDYYYVKSDCTVVHGKDYFISKGNGILPNGTYTFDADGKLVLPTTKKNGLQWEDGSLFYYIDDEIQKTGWTEVSGKTYYFDPESGEGAVDGVFWLPRPTGYDPDQWNIENNENYEILGYVQNSYFIFSPEGVFLNSNSGMYSVAATSKVVGGNASSPSEELIVWTDRGEVPWHPGLVKSQDGYYYFTTGTFEAGKSFVRDQEYYVSKTNDLSLPSGTGTFSRGKYTFDSTGKIVFLDGIVKEGDVWTYYVSGAKVYAGLIKIDGDYYYVKSDCTVVHGQDYFVSKTNDLLPSDTYTFNEDGKIVFEAEPEPVIKQGVVLDDDGELRYYVDGVSTYAGLVQEDGYYYYFPGSKLGVRSKNYTITKTNGLKPQATYEFDADGHMVIANGIVKQDNGTWLYYVDGSKVYAGIIEIDGSYYYVNSSFKVIHGQDYFVSKGNGIVPNGTYTFDADGKLVM